MLTFQVLFLALLVTLLGAPQKTAARDVTTTADDQQDDDQHHHGLSSFPEHLCGKWVLNDTFVMRRGRAPVAVSSSLIIQRLPIFIPAAGTLEYKCAVDDSNGSDVSASLTRVRASLTSTRFSYMPSTVRPPRSLSSNGEGKASGSAPARGAEDRPEVFTYEGVARAYPNNSTVVHSVEKSSRDGYAGRNLTRLYDFDVTNATNGLVAGSETSGEGWRRVLFTPEERVYGMAFALLWERADEG